MKFSIVLVASLVVYSSAFSLNRGDFKDWIKDLEEKAKHAAEQLKEKAEEIKEHIKQTEQDLKEHKFCAQCVEDVTSAKSKGDEFVEAAAEKLEVLCFKNEKCISTIESAVSRAEEYTPRQFCEAVRLCDKSVAKRSFSDWIKDVEEKAKHAAESVKEAAEDVYHKAQDEVKEIGDKIKQTEHDLMEHKFCDECVDDVTTAKAKGDEFVEAAAEKIEIFCFKNEKCISTIESAVSNIEQYTPRQFCEAVRMCDKSVAKRSLADWLKNVEEKAKEAVKTVEEKAEEAVQKAKDEIQDIKDKVAEAKSSLTEHKFCDKCVEDITAAKAKGDEFVESAAHNMEVLCFKNQMCIDAIESAVSKAEEYTPRQFCEAVRLCEKSQTKRSFSDWFKNVEEQAKKAVETLKEKAEEAVQKAKDDIKKITDKVQETKTSLKEHKFCEACVDDITAAKAKGDEFVESAAKRVEVLCFKNEKCIDAIESAVSRAEEYTPRQFCEAVRLCDKSVAKRSFSDWIKNVEQKAKEAAESVQKAAEEAVQKAREEIKKIADKVEETKHDFETKQFCDKCVKDITAAKAKGDEYVTKAARGIETLCFNNAKCIQYIEDAVTKVHEYTPEQFCSAVHLC